MLINSIKNTKLLAPFLIFMLLASAAAFWKLTYYDRLDYSVDYYSYIETAKLFSGLPAQLSVWRVLKPLSPFLTSLLSGPFEGDYSRAFFSQIAVFYLLLTAVSFSFFRNFFRDDSFKSIGATAMFIFGYPVIRYGLGPFTEAGAWFFYTASLLLSLLFIRKPSARITVLNAFTLALGFLYKEYSIVSLLIANIAILYCECPKRDKLKYLAILNGIFLSLNAYWQIMVYLKYRYTYFDWYIDGGLSAAPVSYTPDNMLMSFIYVLLLGWAFVIPGLLEAKHEITERKQRIFLASLAITPFLCLLWGAVQSRLFYVTAPALIIFSVIGIDKIFKNKMLKYAAVFLIVAANFYFLLRL